MRLYKKIHIKSTFARIMAYYIMVVVFTTILLSSILYYQFSKTTIEEIQLNSLEKLTQNANQMNLIREHIFSLGVQLLSDSEIIDVIYGGYCDELGKYMILRKIDNITRSDSIIHSIYLYNGKNMQMISNIDSAINVEFDKKMKLMLDNYSSKYNRVFIPNSITYRKPNYDLATDNIMTVIFASYTNEVNIKGDAAVEHARGAVIINLKAEYIRKGIAALSPDKKSSTIILDNECNVICDSHMASFGKNIAGQDYIRKMLSSGVKKGYEIITLDDKKYLVTYLHSGPMPFILVNLSSYDLMFSKLDSLRLHIIILCMLILAFGILLSVLAARNVYSPFKKLISSIGSQLFPGSDILKEKKKCGDVEYLSKTFFNVIQKTNDLESTIKDNMPLIKKFYIKQLFAGNIPSKQNSPKDFQKIRTSFAGSMLYVITFGMDGYSKFIRNNTNIVQSDFKASIEGIITDSFSGKFYAEAGDFESDHIPFIVRADQSMVFDNVINTILEEIQDEISSMLNITVTCAIGISVKRVEDLHLSYVNSLNLLNYRFVYGYNSIITNQRIDTSVTVKYAPIDKNEERLIQALKVCDIKKVEAELNEIMKIISNNQYDYIMLVINQLALDIPKAVEPLIDSYSEDLDYNNFYGNLNSIGTLQEMKEWFLLMCIGVVERLEKKKSGRKADMINEVLSYINDNYCSSDIFAERLAEMVNLTPGYFGKLFSECTGKSLNEYITGLRMARAKELLENGNAPISEISQSIGFSNSTYFTTTFKKNFGMTPQQYRMDKRSLKI